MMRTHRIGVFSAAIVAGLAGAGYASRFGPDELIITDDPDFKSPPPPPPHATTVVAKTAADHEALRAAQLRRERKLARQAKGFRS